LIAFIVLCVAGLFAFAAGWLTPHALTPARMVNAFEPPKGPQAGFRRNHAKGVCFNGYFEGNGGAAALSKSAIFQPGRVPVIGRFALAGGQAYAADAPHTVRSMAVLFKLADGEEWRSGMNNIPVFPVNSAQGFYDLLVASAPDPATGKPDAAKMTAFFASHPEAAQAMPLIRSYPVSSGFENSTYNSLNAFDFVNARGKTTPVRWAMVPVQPFEPAGTNVEKTGTNYLFDALIASVHRHPLQWHLMVTIGAAGDLTADATVPWPANRQQIDAGLLTVDEIDSEDVSPARDINFDPLILPGGIVGSDDPLLSARSAAYSQSFTRREGEPKQPSAVSPAETKP
jgi:catalase